MLRFLLLLFVLCGAVVFGLSRQYGVWGGILGSVLVLATLGLVAWISKSSRSSGPSTLEKMRQEGRKRLRTCPNCNTLAAAGASMCDECGERF